MSTPQMMMAGRQPRENRYLKYWIVNSVMDRIKFCKQKLQEVFFYLCFIMFNHPCLLSGVFDEKKQKTELYI